MDGQTLEQVGESLTMETFKICFDQPEHLWANSWTRRSAEIPSNQNYFIREGFYLLASTQPVKTRETEKLDSYLMLKLVLRKWLMF